MICVVFDKSDTLPQFGHVILLHKIKNQWYYIDFMGKSNILMRKIDSKTALKILDHEEYYVYDKPKLMSKLGKFTFISCVSMVKLYLGINNKYILTPDHLKLYLKGYHITLKDKIVRGITAIKYFFFIPRG